MQSRPFPCSQRRRGCPFRKGNLPVTVIGAKAILKAAIFIPHSGCFHKADHPEVRSRSSTVLLHRMRSLKTARLSWIVTNYLNFGFQPTPSFVTVLEFRDIFRGNPIEPPWATPLSMEIFSDPILMLAQRVPPANIFIRCLQPVDWLRSRLESEQQR